jgi:hypothetical protein
MSNPNPDNDNKTWSNPSDWTDPGCWTNDDPWDFPFLEFWDSIDLKAVINDPEEIVRLQKVWVLEQLSRANGAASNEQPRAKQSKVGNGAEPAADGAAEPNTTERGAAAYPDTLDALKEHQFWVFWQNIDVPGRGKTKLPYNPRSEALAQCNNPDTWADWAWTARVAKKYSNQIGIVLAKIDDKLHLAGVDLDSCRDPKTGELQLWAKEVIERFDSYTEVSPSRTGAKIFFWYRLADNPELDKLFGGPNDGNSNHGKQFKKGGGEHPQAIEIYRSNRYFTVTGLQFENYANLRIVPVEDFRWLIEEAGPALKGASASAKASSSAYKGSNNQGNDNSRSGKAFREGARMKAGGATYEQIAEALRNSSDPDIAAWTKEKGESNNERELHRIYDRANAGFNALPEGCTLEHFRAYMPDHNYIHMPTMVHWPAASVNSRLPPVPMHNPGGSPMLDKKGKQKTMTPSVFLDKTKPVEQIIWAPGEPMLVEDRYLVEGSGWIDHKGGRGLNSYRPPTIKHGDPRKAGPWVELARKLYHGEAKRIIQYMASKAQRPEVKINHAQFLGGDPGIGKDTLLEALKRAVGPWNFIEIKPGDLFETFNPHIKSVILRISEAHDLGEVSRYQFYERIKTYAAAPPDVLLCNDKHIKKFSVLNCMGLIITSNHLTDGIYLQADDRRHDIHWSNRKPEDFEPGYWNKMWSWYENGGFEHVAAYLATLDISAFDPKAPPPKTDAFWKIVNANRSSEEGELADVIDLLGNPKALTLDDLIAKTVLNHSLAEWLKDRKNRRNIPYRLEACEYEPQPNPDAKDGLWKIGDKRQTVYVQKVLTMRESMEAAIERVKRGTTPPPPPPNFAGGTTSGSAAGSGTDEDYDAPLDRNAT